MSRPSRFGWCESDGRLRTYKHSGFGFAGRLLLGGPGVTLGLESPWAGGSDGGAVGVFLPGLHADQDLLHHGQLLLSHRVQKDRDQSLGRNE